MALALHFPTPPHTYELNGCKDHERKITPRCWDLAAVQAALRAGQLSIELSLTANEDVGAQLPWYGDDIKNFFLCLGSHRYNDSEWCLPPEHGNQCKPMPADSYVMGFDRIKAEENQSRQPYVYVKFTVREKSGRILVFSLHPTRF
jgi:hypothetical protein